MTCQRRRYRRNDQRKTWKIKTVGNRAEGFDFPKLCRITQSYRKYSSRRRSTYRRTIINLIVPVVPKRLTVNRRESEKILKNTMEIMRFAVRYCTIENGKTFVYCRTPNLYRTITFYRFVLGGSSIILSYNRISNVRV